MLKTVSSLGNFANVTITSTDPGAAAGPLLELYRDSASPAANDTLGEIEFNGEDSAGNKQQYALIHGSIISPTSGSEGGQLHFETATAGVSTEKMIIGTTNLVINEIGAIYNVRIEGDTDANLLYTDATNSRVGIGTISPAEKLDVVGNIKLSGNVIPASGFGIDFSATPGTGTSELLADYEEGTWTPLIGGESGQSGQIYGVQRGAYTKIGRMVVCTFDVLLSNKGTITGDVVIKGLPFTTISGDSARYPSVSIGLWQNLTTSYVYISGIVIDGTTYASLKAATAAATALSAIGTADLTNDARFSGTLTYFAA